MLVYRIQARDFQPWHSPPRLSSMFIPAAPLRKTVLSRFLALIRQTSPKHDWTERPLLEVGTTTETCDARRRSLCFRLGLGLSRNLSLLCLSRLRLLASLRLGRGLRLGSLLFRRFCSRLRCRSSRRLGLL